MHIAIDLDGTLCQHQEPFNPKTIGEPLPGAVAFVHKLVAAGHQVTVFTARGNWARLQGQLMDLGFPRLGVTAIKLPEFDLIIDDRAFRFFNEGLWQHDELFNILTEASPWWHRKEAADAPVPVATDQGGMGPSEPGGPDAGVAVSGPPPVGDVHVDSPGV